MFNINTVCAQQKAPKPTDWQQILGGDIMAYQKYNIKSLKLLENDVVINTILFLPAENKLEIQNNDTKYQYSFDKSNRLQELVNKGNTNTFTYFGNENTLKSQSVSFVADSLLYERKTTFPYQNRLDISWFEQTVFRKDNHQIVSQKSEGIRLHPTDSLWKYRQTINNKNYTRRYFNGNNVNYKTTANGFESDSTAIQKNGNTFKYYNVAVGDTLKQTENRIDSIYFTKRVNNKLRYMRVNDYDKTIKELFYEPENEQLTKSIFYTYYPTKEGTKLRWKVTTQDAKTGKITEDYPFKRYYKLKNGILIQKRKINVRTVPASSDAIYDKRLSRNNYLYEVTSTSVLVSARNAQKFNTYLYAMMDDDLNMFYTKANINIADKPEVSLSNGYKERINDKFIKKSIERATKVIYYNPNFPKNTFKVQLTTQDGKQWECYPFKDFKQVPISVDIVVYLDSE